MDSNKTNEGYLKIFSKYRNRFQNTNILPEITKRIATEVEILKTFQTCLSFGPGPGEYDINFIKLCLPNLKKLIVVEMNPSCVEELKINLKANFGDELEVEIHGMTIENFMETYKGSNIDIAIAFHVLYHLKTDDLRSFLNSCFNSWLHPEHGLLIFALNSLSGDLKNITKQFNFKSYRYLEHVKDEIKEMGLVMLKNFPFCLSVDLREYGEDINFIILNDWKLQINPDTIMEGLREAVPTGFGSFHLEFCVIAKHDFLCSK